MGAEIVKAFILGIVQGFTEWLPISSTAHLLLFDKLLHVSLSDEAMKLFLVLIQLGSVLAVVIVYFNVLWPFKRDINETKGSLKLWLKIIIGCIPAAVLGLVLDNYMEKFETSYVIAAALFVYGILYIIVEKRIKVKKIEPKYSKTDEVSYFQAFKIGCFQALAIIPGTSRSGSTILGGLIMGFSRELAAKFSFFMAIPVMAGASLLRFFKYFKYVVRDEWIFIAFGTIVSFAVSVISIKVLIGFVKKHDFTAFGIYRILLAVLILVFAFV